mmetsp:Transcript_46271/g.148133  ORF Transcript_46271/g.148133 Transcript_46271/m.148133 type:complete len:522 (+) Transcript_46271:101-1666(+)
MALSRPARAAAIVVCVASFLAAVFLPQIEQLLKAHGRSDLLETCPLGYEGTKPASHGSAGPGGEEGSTATAVFSNARIWTGDTQLPWADTMAVGRNGRLLYVGSAPLPPHIDAAGARLEDLGRAYVIPGLIDAHAHLLLGGLSLRRLDLRGVKSRGELATRAAAAADEVGEGGWLLGWGWNHEEWGGELPTSEWLDPASRRGVKIWAMRTDGHMGLANRAALAAAGVGPGTPDPEGGRILRGAGGAPTGVLVDTAMGMVAAAAPEPTPEEEEQAIALAAEHMLAHGVTSVHDMGLPHIDRGVNASWDLLEGAYQRMADTGRLPIRVRAYVPLPTWERLADRLRVRGGAHLGGRLSWGGLKEFADGSLGSRTALFREPYSDAPDTSGLRTWDPKAGSAAIAGAARAGMHTAVHAIGDRAVDEVADTLAGGWHRGQRGRVEHAQHLSGPAAISKLLNSRSTAVVNPLHMASDAAVCQARLGPRAIAGRAYAYGSMQSSGVPLALHGEKFSKSRFHWDFGNFLL